MIPSTTAITFTSVPARSSQTGASCAPAMRREPEIITQSVGTKDAKLPIGLVHPRHHPRTRQRIAFESQLNEGGRERMEETHGSPRQHAR